jgi:hypothetical protein
MDVTEKRKIFDPAGNRTPAMKRMGSGIFQGTAPKLDWKGRRT